MGFENIDKDTICSNLTELEIVMNGSTWAYIILSLIRGFCKDIVEYKMLVCSLVCFKNSLKMNKLKI